MEDNNNEVHISPLSIDTPISMYYCKNCDVPLIVDDSNEKAKCSVCNSEVNYMAKDIRPVFPEERLLIEVLLDRPMEFHTKNVWANNNRYFINGELITIDSSYYTKYDSNELIEKMKSYSDSNDYSFFDNHIDKFIKYNSRRYNLIFDEASRFVKETAEKYPRENTIISFSGGKDSTVVADVVTRALRDPNIVRIFGDTTLEFPMTMDYAKRYRKDNPKAIFKTAKNREQNFLEVCKDIGPPARMLRWCCYMFKTGPITRVINNFYRDQEVLTFYGIRKHESVSRSKYNRVEGDSESVKIQQQTVAAPIFSWKDVDVWLYILTTGIDFNSAYRLGYDRVGCWCCPNNNLRAQFLSRIYMSEESKIWRDFLIDFAKKIGKPDPEVYIDTGKWKARQGGNGLESASDVKLKFSNCTSEENSRIYSLNKPIESWFYELFYPFGVLAEELGRKLVNEKIFIDKSTKVPIVSIQSYEVEDCEYSVKIKTMNVENHDDLHRMLAYQVRKYNACRNCLKCESVCTDGAITIRGNEYHIDSNKCKRCKKCVTAKYIEGGCLMDKYLKTKE